MSLSLPNSDVLNNVGLSILGVFMLFGVLLVFYAIMSVGVKPEQILNQAPRKKMSALTEMIAAGVFLAVIVLVEQLSKPSDSEQAKPLPLFERISVLMFVSWIAIAWWAIRKVYPRLHASFQIIAGFVVAWRISNYFDDMTLTRWSILIGACYLIVSGLEQGAKSADKE